MSLDAYYDKVACQKQSLEYRTRKREMGSEHPRNFWNLTLMDMHEHCKISTLDWMRRQCLVMAPSLTPPPSKLRISRKDFKNWLHARQKRRSSRYETGKCSHELERTHMVGSMGMNNCQNYLVINWISKLNSWKPFNHTIVLHQNATTCANRSIGCDLKRKSQISSSHQSCL